MFSSARWSRTRFLHLVCCARRRMLNRDELWNKNKKCIAIANRNEIMKRLFWRDPVWELNCVYRYDSQTFIASIQLKYATEQLLIVTQDCHNKVYTNYSDLSGFHLTTRGRAKQDSEGRGEGGMEICCLRPSSEVWGHAPQKIFNVREQFWCIFVLLLKH